MPNPELRMADYVRCPTCGHAARTPPETGSAAHSKAAAPTPTALRASGYGCDVCRDTGMCPTPSGDAVRPCPCRATNPVIIARQPDRVRLAIGKVKGHAQNAEA